ncbi:hypothetical protein A8U91_01333 [Halomonas elongata]|uniref:Uncharacterized protein n=1 Tax=Halomonas elongata TaxID=2746 RepID=A0A1B8P3Y1_HALEL|nr:hypothetical protein [Halomonas elongata]OBX36985.1 hypothetical protein A8U91_01333 [Halomonas elongata]
MMGFEDINLAIETRLYEWDGPPVAYDNVPAGQAVQDAQDAKEPWVRLTIQHGNSLTAGVGSSPCVRRAGSLYARFSPPSASAPSPHHRSPTHWRRICSTGELARLRRSLPA